MKAGDLMITPDPMIVVVEQLVAWESQPLSEELAQKPIVQQLEKEQEIKIANDEMQHLRSAATIEYLGEFTDLHS